LYKACARDSGLKGAEVIAEVMSSMCGGIIVHQTAMTEEVIADPIAVEQLSQEEVQNVNQRLSLGSEMAKANSDFHDLALATDEFDVKMLEDEPINDRIDEDDEPSSTDNEEESNDDQDGIVDEGNESGVPQSLVPAGDVPMSSRIDWMLYYTEEELSALKLKNINLVDAPNYKDISRIDSAVCDSALMLEEGNPRTTEEVIKKEQLFESLEVVKFFFQDYAVRHIGHIMLQSQIYHFDIL
jgi:hypothetical protein